MNLNQVTIKSQDVNRASAFYQKLGLQLIVDASPRYVRFQCPIGDSTFSISHNDAENGASSVLYFETDDVDKIYRDLTKAGIQFKSQPQDKRWLWREADLYDPDGNPLKVFSAGKNRKNPPWKIKTKPWYASFIESPVNLMK